ncbi:MULTISPECIES: response regulator [Bacillus]|uniref:response regulator n=1 Tax=Bacillus TaxID=1386 RepID=UPI0002F6062E|nr:MULTISPECIES: response regulator [Bacillus]
MSQSPKLEAQITLQNDFINENQMQHFFNILSANVERSRSPITVSMLSLCNQTVLQKEDYIQIENAMGAFLQSEIRKSDLICKLSRPLEWCIILTLSGEKEAYAFIKRLLSNIQNKMEPLFNKYDLQILTTISEINNCDASFGEVINVNRQLLKNGLNKSIVSSSQFKKRKIEHIKVSILEDNEIFSQALSSTLENLSINHFQLDIQTFHDGYEFLQSDWYYTSHTHIILVNDILSRKNGLEVVHRLRELPNNKKFIIFMMTKRKSEQEMINAYSSGVDEYLIKPLNIRLFEALMKRVLERLWS